MTCLFLLFFSCYLITFVQTQNLDSIESFFYAGSDNWRPKTSGALGFLFLLITFTISDIFFNIMQATHLAEAIFYYRWLGGVSWLKKSLINFSSFHCP